MILDLVVIAFLTLFAVVGAFDGALAQGARLLAVAGAGLLGRPLGDLLAPAVARAVRLPDAVVGPLVTAAACLVLFLLLNFAGRRIARGLTRAPPVRAADRGAGALFGALQAAVIAWIAVSLLVAVEEKAGTSLGGEGSLAARVVRKHNFFSALAQVSASRPASRRSSRRRTQLRSIRTFSPARSGASNITSAITSSTMERSARAPRRRSIA